MHRFYILNNRSKRNICPITNEDISGQKPGSKFLSVSKTKTIIENEPERFAELKSEYLSKGYKGRNYANLPVEVQIVELSHHIRSKDYNKRNNPRNNTKRAIFRVMNEPTLCLFDNFSLISDEKKRIAGLI